MDEGAGLTAYDGSDNSNDGIVNGGNWVNGKFGGAWNSSRSGQISTSVGIPDVLDVSTDYSLSAWIYKKADVTNEGLIFGKQGWHQGFVTYPTDGIWFTKWNDSTSFVVKSGTGLDTWNHIVGTFNSSDSYLRIYVDGILTDSIQFTGSSMDRSDIIYFGKYGSWNTDVLIDDARIYNRALSAEEVRYHYNKGGPVAEWKFDEGSGQTAFDESFNNNDGTLGATTGVEASDPTWVEGKYGGALSFDGVDDYVSVPAISFLATGATFTAWMYLDSFTNAWLAGKSDSYNTYIKIHDSTTVRVQTDTTGTYKDYIVPTIQTGQWYFVTVIRDSDTTRVYLNGIESSTGGQTQTNVLTIDQIGKYAVNQEFNGSIDSVRIYNYARTAEQILMDYNAGVGTYFR
jgi:hypothetical protein